MNVSKSGALRQVITSDQIQKRVKELGRQISDDYKGQTIQALAVLENSFIFLADLVRALDVPVVCQFIKPKYTRPKDSDAADVMEIFFSHEPDIRGQHILLVEGLVHSGVTSEFSLEPGTVFRFGGRDLSDRLWPRSRRTDQPQFALPGGKLKTLSDLSHESANKPFSCGKGKM